MAEGIAAEYGPKAARLASFPTADAGALHERLAALLALPAEERRALGLAARRAVERHWSWAAIAERLLED